MATFPTGNLDEGMIDLGKEVSTSANPMDMSKKPKTVSVMDYPSLYIRDIPELDNLPDGQFYFLAKGQVTRHTEENPIAGTEEDTVDGEGGDYGKGCECEISVISMRPIGDVKTGAKNPKIDSTKALDDTLSKIEQDKADAAAEE